jgi:hypothetical protein
MKFTRIATILGTLLLFAASAFAQVRATAGTVSATFAAQPQKYGDSNFVGYLYRGADSVEGIADFSFDHKVTADDVKSVAKTIVGNDTLADEPKTGTFKGTDYPTLGLAFTNDQQKSVAFIVAVGNDVVVVMYGFTTENVNHDEFSGFIASVKFTPSVSNN